MSLPVDPHAATPTGGVVGVQAVAIDVMAKVISSAAPTVNHERKEAVRVCDSKDAGGWTISDITISPAVRDREGRVAAPWLGQRG